jgi:hypothetical protein
MRRLQPLAVVLLLPALALLMAAPGCGKKTDEQPKKPGGDQAAADGTKPGKEKQGDGGKEKDDTLTELASTGWGTLSGTITYDGDPPAPVKLAIASEDHKKQCFPGASERELIDQTWLVDPKSKGVENAVIFLKAPAGKYFKIKDEDKTRKQTVVLDQPHCAFIPHAFVYFAEYYDPKTDKLKRSSDVFEIKNGANFPHNTAWGKTDNNAPGGKTLPPGKVDVHAFKADEEPISFKCDIHPWMNAKGWILDHPYGARTDKDGKFEIKNVPTGVELYVVGWHEGAGFFHGGKQGTKMKLQAEEKLDLKIKAK